jgi:Ca2+/Na+ antiporter
VFFPLSIARQTIRLDAPVMLFVAVLSFWVLRTGHQISRREGIVLLGIYAVYLGVLLHWR